MTAKVLIPRELLRGNGLVLGGSGAQRRAFLEALHRTAQEASWDEEMGEALWLEGAGRLEGFQPHPPEFGDGLLLVPEVGPGEEELLLGLLSSAGKHGWSVWASLKEEAGQVEALAARARHLVEPGGTGRLAGLAKGAEGILAAIRPLLKEGSFAFLSSEEEGWEAGVLSP